MKQVFPIILTPAQEGGYVVTIPTLEINTQGDTMPDAIEMARDAIGLWGICELSAGREIPVVENFSPNHEPNEIVTLVDVDFEAYRRANEMRTVRRNVTLPSWLNDAAEKSGINVSSVLQEGLKKVLNVSGPTLK